MIYRAGDLFRIRLIHDSSYKIEAVTRSFFSARDTCIPTITFQKARSFSMPQFGDTRSTTPSPNSQEYTHNYTSHPKNMTASHPGRGSLLMIFPPSFGLADPVGEEAADSTTEPERAEAVPAVEDA